MATELLPSISRVAGGRDFLTTTEFAGLLSRSPQTARKYHHEQGHAWGIRPIKIGRSLLWPVAAVNRLLGGGA